MNNIENIDKNFKINTQLTEKNVKFFDASEPPIRIYGAAEINDKGYWRLPKNVAENVSEQVAFLSSYTAGIRARFSTNSNYIAIWVKYSEVHNMPHMPVSGAAGFDMYVCENNSYEYAKSFIPPVDVRDSCCLEYWFESSEMRDITINFPLYSGVASLYIGIKEGSELKKGLEYDNVKPIVYYGSSITQGGCASRPGMSYEAMLSREFNFDYINLGFSGAAKGEKAITEYIASLDMCCFVYDYDHNAPDPEHLEKTHKPMFDAIRKAHPEIPIIMASMPMHRRNFAYALERQKVILDTYNAAVKSGDKNVYFIDGMKMYENFGMGSCTVDGIHPNDLGFFAMYKAFSEVMEKVIK